MEVKSIIDVAYVIKTYISSYETFKLLFLWT